MKHDLSSKKYGRLTVLHRAGSNKHRHILWLCKCDCGTEKVVSGVLLKRGDVHSCGCLRKEITSKKFKKHGESVQAEHTAEYRAWRSMINRCENPRVNSYKNYGGRGIKVCTRWRHSYGAFLKNLGRKPSEAHSLDRIDVDGGYFPSNCRWSDAKQQARNRRHNFLLTYKGETKTLAAWYEEGGLPNLVLNRLRRGWNPHDAINTPRYHRRIDRSRKHSRKEPVVLD